MAKAKGAHYVNNKDFLHAMIAWRETVDEAVDSGETPPPVTNYIGECFLPIYHINQTSSTTHIEKK
jgi:hypothetical protein